MVASVAASGAVTKEDLTAGVLSKVVLVAVEMHAVAAAAGGATAGDAASLPLTGAASMHRFFVLAAARSGATAAVATGIDVDTADGDMGAWMVGLVASSKGVP